MDTTNARISLNFLYRIALVEDAEEEQRYYETLGGLRVFRLTPNDPQADMFYAVKIAKSTSGQEADMLIPQPACGRLKMRELALAFRAYCEPQTKTGPSYSEILFDRAILFKHR